MRSIHKLSKTKDEIYWRLSVRSISVNK